MWMLLVLSYGLLKGGREIVKKKCLEKNSVAEVLFFYTLIGFLFLLPDISGAFQVDKSLLPWIFLKSFVIFLAWILSFLVIKQMPVSLYGVLDMSRVLFAYIMGIAVLGEKLTIYQMIGLPLVLLGLFLLRIIKSKKNNGEPVPARLIVIAITSCVLNSISGVMDKILMKQDLTSGQLQFWYMLFLVVLYGLFLLIKKEPLHLKTLSSNYWILLLSIMFIIGDRALFIANSYPESKVTVMTLIKQSACFVTIILGRLVYKEKNILKKSICAAVVLTGILIAVLE